MLARLRDNYIHIILKKKKETNKVAKTKAELERVILRQTLKTSTQN